MTRFSSYPSLIVAKAKSFLDYFELNTFFLVLIFLGGLLALVMQAAPPDPDLWGHIRYGQEILERGHLTWEDPYSFILKFHEPVNPRFPWIRHAWVSQILIALSWESLGAFGLWLFRLVLVGGLLGAILLVARATTRNLLEIVVPYTLAWGGIAPMMAFRPQLFTFFLFTVLLFLIFRVHLTRKWIPAWTLAWIPVMLLWVNAHGGFLAGLALLGLLAGVTLLQAVAAPKGSELASQTRRLLAWTVVGFLGGVLVTLINPYGLELYRWLRFDQTTPRAIVMTEWVPIRFFTGHFPYLDLKFPFFKLLLLVFAVSLAFTRRRLDPFEVLLLIALALGGVRQVRHTAFFCVAAAMFIPKHLESALRGRWLRDISATPPAPSAQRVVKMALVLALLLSVAIAGLRSRVYTPWGIPMKTADFPMRAVHFLRDNGIRGNLAVWFNWAQFVLWHLGRDPISGRPAHNLLAYDGRFRNVYSVGPEQVYMAFHYGQVFLPGTEQLPWDALLDRYPTDVVLMDKDWPMLSRMKKRTDFELIYVSPPPEEAVIFVRKSRYPEITDKARRGELKLRGLKPFFWFPGEERRAGPTEGAPSPDTAQEARPSGSRRPQPTER